MRMQTCVNVVGLGYIGLSTALMMASHGVPVVGTDRSREVIDSLSRGSMTFEEKGMDGLFREAVDRGIRFTGEYVKTDMYIISVATPFDKATKKIDPGDVVSAVESVLDVCREGAILVIESTISPGTIDRHIRPLLEKRGMKAGREIHLAHAPERILPGNMIEELLHNCRTIGADSPAVAERVREVYASFCQGEIVMTDIRTAEMSKVVENAFRDVNIAFANELAKICRNGGMDVREVIRIANRHPRVNILNPGPGVGGHCISVDPWFLVGDFPQEARLIRQAREINDSMPEFVLERVRAVMKESHIEELTRVGFYGLTYKENVDDIRESPTLQLYDLLEYRTMSVPKCYDPMCGRAVCPGQVFSFEQFLAGIDLLVVMVGHDHLRENWNLVRGKTVLDTRDCGLPADGQNRLFFL